MFIKIRNVGICVLLVQFVKVQLLCACSSGVRILQGGPLPMASDGNRIVVEGLSYFPNDDASNRKLRPNILFYSRTTKKLMMFRLDENKDLPKYVRALAISPDSIFVNGDKGVIARKDNDVSWHKLTGLDDEDVTAMAWVDNSLWIGTTRNLLIYSSGRIKLSFPIEKYFDGADIISIIPIGDKVFVGTHKQPTVPASSSSNSLSGNCDDSCGKSGAAGFSGAVYVGNTNGTRFVKYNPNGVFSDSSKPRVLFDVYPSTVAGQLVLIHGDGFDTGAVAIESANLHMSTSPSPSRIEIPHYTPFMAIIAKSGEQIEKNTANMLADFFEQGFKNMSHGARIWGYEARFALWARINAWDKFLKLENPDRLWATSFLDQYPDEKAQETLLNMVNNTGASTGVVLRMEKGKGKLVNDLLMSIVKMEVPFAEPSKDETAVADSRNPDQTRYLAARALRTRMGQDVAPFFVALLKSGSNLTEHVDKDIRSMLYDIAPEKWIIKQTVISGEILNCDNRGHTCGYLLTMKENPEKIILQRGYDTDGKFRQRLYMPLKGTYVLHYGKDKKETKEFQLETSEIQLGTLEGSGDHMTPLVEPRGNSKVSYPKSGLDYVRWGESK